MDFLGIYNAKIYAEAQEELSEAVEQIDEVIVLTAIVAALAAGVIFRVIDGIRGNKPKVGQYIKGLIKWAIGEYSDGSLSINAIRQTAYEVMKEEQEIEKEFGPSFSKILSKKLLNGVKKGSKEFAKILGEAIGRIAKRADMSKSDLDKVIKGT